MFGLNLDEIPYGDDFSNVVALNENYLRILVGNDPKDVKRTLDHDRSDLGRSELPITTLFGYAIKYSRVEVARMLLEYYGACAKSPLNKSKLIPLQYAARLRDKPIIDLLLEFKADPKVSDSSYHSLIHLVLLDVIPDIENSPDHQEIQKTIIDIIELLIGRGLDVNKKTSHGETPLHYAVKYRLFKVAKFLVSKGAKVNCANKKGETLAFALLESDVKIRETLNTLISFRQSMTDSSNFLKWLIARGLNVDIKTKKNKSALELAAEMNAKHVMKVLLDHTKDIFFETKKKQTILHLLFWQNSGGSQQVEYDNEIAMKLILKGAPLDVADINGDTPFHVAARQRRLDILCKMLDRGININACDGKGVPIWRVAMDTFMDCQYQDRIIKLINQGVDVNRKNEHGRTPVETAARYKQAKLLKVLDDHGADFNIMNDSNENLLHVISKPVADYTPPFDRATVDLLISKGLNVNAYNVNGMTPLHVACRLENNVEVVKALIEHGAKIDCREKLSKRTPLHFAALVGDAAIVKCLIELDAEIDCKDEVLSTPLHLAARESHKDVVKILADSGANVNARSNDGLTPILTAVRYNARNQVEDVVDTLIKAGAEIHCRLIESNYTPLHEASIRCNANVVKCLLDNGADVLCQDNTNQWSPLHVAVSSGDVEIVRMLIENGADIRSRDINLLTPLHQAVRKEHDDVIRYLVKCGADINAKESTGKTPLHLAIHSQNKTVETLLELGARMDMMDIGGYTPLLEALSRDNRAGFDCLIEFGANINEIGSDGHELFVEELMEQKTTAEILIHHFVKLTALGHPVSDNLMSYVNMNKQDIKTMHEECLEEIEFMKRSMIKNQVESSIYSLLHVLPKKRYPFFKRREYRVIVDRKTRSKIYPIYGDIIMASYRETMSYEKIFLIAPARRAWYDLTGIYLPEVCVNHILRYLDLDNLKLMIKRERKIKRKISPTLSDSAVTKVAKKRRKTKV